MTLGVHSGHYPCSTGLTGEISNATPSTPSSLRPSPSLPSCPSTLSSKLSRGSPGPSGLSGHSGGGGFERRQTRSPSPTYLSPPPLSSSSSACSTPQQRTPNTSPPNIIPRSRVDKRRESLLASPSLRVHPFINMGQGATKLASAQVSPMVPQPSPVASSNDEPASSEDRGERAREMTASMREHSNSILRERKVPVAAVSPVKTEDETSLVSPVTVEPVRSSSDKTSVPQIKIDPAAVVASNPTAAKRGLGLVRKLSFRSKPKESVSAVGTPVSIPTSVSTPMGLGPPRPERSTARSPTVNRGLDINLPSATSEASSQPKPRLLSRAASMGHLASRPRPTRVRAGPAPVSVGPAIVEEILPALPANPPPERSTSLKSDPSPSRLGSSPPSASLPPAASTTPPPAPPPLRSLPKTPSRDRRSGRSVSGSPRSRASLTVRREREWRAKLATLSIASPPRSPPPMSGPRPPPRKMPRPATHHVSSVDDNLHVLPRDASVTPKKASSSLRRSALPPLPQSVNSPSASEFGSLAGVTTPRELGNTFGPTLDVSPAVSAVGKHRAARSVASLAHSRKSSLVSQSVVSSAPSAVAHHFASSPSPSPSLQAPPSPAFTLALSLKAPHGAQSPSRSGTDNSLSPRTITPSNVERRQSGTSTLPDSMRTSSPSTSNTWMPDDRVVVSRASVPDMAALRPASPIQSPISAVTPRRGTFEATSASLSRRRRVDLPCAPAVSPDLSLASSSQTFSPSLNTSQQSPGFDEVMQLPPVPPLLRRQGTSASNGTTNSTATSTGTGPSEPAYTPLRRRQYIVKPAFFQSQTATVVPAHGSTGLPTQSAYALGFPYEAEGTQLKGMTTHTPDYSIEQLDDPRSPQRVHRSGQSVDRPYTQESSWTSPAPSYNDYGPGTATGALTEEDAGGDPLRGFYDLTPGLESGRRPRKTGIPMDVSYLCIHN